MAVETKAQENNKEKRKILPIIIIFSVIVLVLIFALIFVIISKSPSESENNPNVTNPADAHMINGVLQYDEGAIVLDPDELQNQIDDLNQKVQDGYIGIAHKNRILSKDGETFNCYIQNNADNKYDIFINIYKDASGQEQLLLTGLIPPGSGINQFKSEIKLEQGTYEALVVITQVEDDHQTLRDGQLFLLVDMMVDDNYNME